MKIVPVLLLTALIAGCGSSDPQAAEKLKHQGREETRGIRNSQNIGYSGKAIADHVDEALDANEKRNKELQQAVDPNAPPPAPP